ncbi:MAG: lipopolysaccharide transport periplasmic protein LptA [Deltaproteobacteria bacterium]|nr:lipopolysaccharide transport periplasmic protein LptA [Deltaproteobacteria bacterium]
MTRFCGAGVAGLLVIAAAAVAWGEPPRAKNLAFDATRPISMAADRLEVDNKQQVARYVGNVVVVQDNVVLNADMVSIHYKGGASAPGDGSGFSALTGGTGGIRTIVATGNVTIVQDDRKARCDQVVFDQEAETVTLTGQPRLVSGTDILEGQKIVVHIADERVEVVGAPGKRVVATVVPKNMKEGLLEKAQERLKDLQDNPPASEKTGGDDA